MCDERESERERTIHINVFYELGLIVSKLPSYFSALLIFLALTLAMCLIVLDLTIATRTHKVRSVRRAIEPFGGRATYQMIYLPFS